MIAKSAKELRVYKQAYSLAMEIFELSKEWPKEEKYGSSTLAVEFCRN